ncbi:MAG: hypothetical protein OEN50_08415, partial [Deltaproteobacteria bacterium]|nr:hypothetical protein [Deltaproteobacteria bacterium]
MSNFPADEIAFRKRQQDAVDARIAMRACQKILLVARGGDVINDNPTSGHEARDNYFINLGVQLRRFDVGEAKREIFATVGEVESVAMKDFDGTGGPGARNVLAR